MKIIRMHKQDFGKIRGFFDIEVSGFTIKGFKIIEHENFVNIIGICETKRYPDNNEEYYCVPWRLLNEGV